jgi:hypothetical protein
MNGNTLDLINENAQWNHKQHTHLNTDISGQCPWKNPEGKTRQLREKFYYAHGENFWKVQQYKSAINAPRKSCQTQQILVAA